MALLPNSGPPLPPTHKPLDPALVNRLATALASKAAGKRVTLEMVQAVAREQNAKDSEVYAAMAFNPNLVFALEQPTLIAVCVGSCQAQGAIPNLAELLK